MSEELQSRIRDILPSYDSLPDLMDTRQVAKLIGVTYGSLNADRTTSRNIGIGYIKVGRLIKYPKTEVAKWLASNAVCVGAGAE